METILLVDDEPNMLDLLSLYLSPQGYKCIKTDSGENALNYLDKQDVDLVLLDIMMPEMDGWETCEEIRKRSDIPIIMLTARDDKADIVKGLKGGADDYISKPFDEDILMARIHAVLRRKRVDKNNKKIEFHGLSLDLDAYRIQYDDQDIVLTPKEFSLLTVFLTNQNMVFTREHLLVTVWGYDGATEDRTIDSHIRNLREKLRNVGFPVFKYLQTVWGIGYKWSEND